MKPIDAPYSRILHQQGLAARTRMVRNKRVGRAILLFVMMMTMGLFYVWSRIQVIEVTHEISQLERGLGQLLEELKVMNITISELKSSERLERIARTKLDMAPPRSHQVVVVKEMSE